MPGVRMFRIVVMKLMAPSTEEAPARCRARMPKSTDGPGWYSMPESGGYTVHPVPGPSPTNAERMSSTRPAASSQKLMLFMRGKAMSGVPIINGMNQFPKPPISAGMTTKNTMMKPCAVTSTL